jgi:hypothetical protein
MATQGSGHGTRQFCIEAPLVSDEQPVPERDESNGHGRLRIAALEADEAAVD